MLNNLLATSIFLGLVNALNHSAPTTSLGMPPCDALVTAGLGHRVLTPTNSEYEPQINTWWAMNSRLHPWCLVLPRTAEEVSLALTTLLEAGDGAGDWNIAVKSGGHNSAAGNSVINGVSIDLGFLNSTHYDKETNIAKLHAGARWVNVYNDLEVHGVTAVGGRDADVGVGGFLLGGGTSYFIGRLGFACDSVINYEVVLTNGNIINANATANSDLWRALKGGGSNFGIVTRYDVEAIPSRDLFHDLRFVSANYSNIVTDTIVDFANHDESLGDNALVTFFTHDLSISTELAIGNIYVNTLGDENAGTSYDKVMRLPAIYNATTKQTMAEAAAGSRVAAGTWDAGATLTLKNDPAILHYSTKLHEQLVKSLSESIGAENFITLMFFQPMPSYLGSLGQRRGGNMLGIEDAKDNAVMWTGGIAVTTDQAALSIAQAHLNAMTAEIRRFSRSVGGDVDLVYLNYADASQDPLESYGADNVQFIRDVAAKYDPSGAFQRRVPGGFKISRVV